MSADIWVPAVKQFAPSISYQSDVGICKTILPNIEVSSEVYYKKMTGILSHKNGESLFQLFDSWENKVTTGNSICYGFETLIKKIAGKSTGWIGYTHSYTFHNFSGLNNGQPFPVRYDIRNRFNLMFSHNINDFFEISSSWEYSSGLPITLSATAYDGEADIGAGNGLLEDFFGIYQPLHKPGKAIYYSGINNFRLSAFHKLDLSVTFKKTKKWGQREWNISLYNVYNKNNIFYLFSRLMNQHLIYLIVEAIKISLLLVFCLL